MMMQTGLNAGSGTIVSRRTTRDTDTDDDETTKVASLFGRRSLYAKFA